MASFAYDLYRYYQAEDFNFNDYKPPLYSFESVVQVVIGYLVSVRIFTWYMQSGDRKPYNLRMVSIVHNLFLCLLSLLMFTNIIYYIIKNYVTGGQDAIYCGARGDYRAGPVHFWYYIFYLSKPYEFIDTYIQIFKKRELNFLHVWHHCTTFLLVWVIMVQEMNIQWVSISANCFVHIWMYYYYFAASLKMDVWWKRYLTMLQIIQFIITSSINLMYGVTYSLGWGCTGNFWGWTFGNFVIISFLILFIQFYQQSYKQKKGVDPKKND